MGVLTIVAVSDLHCGSQSAVALPRMELTCGGTFHPSAAQLELYRAWESIAKDWHKPDILIVAGDAIEGQARRESGVGTWSTELDDQLRCAEGLLRMFDAKRVFIVDGTGYHVDAGGRSLEHLLGERMGAVKIGPHGAYSADELCLKVFNHRFHVAHHIGAGMGWYRTTPMSREMVFAQLNEHHKYKADVLLRGHVHYFCGIEYTTRRGYILPCWQLQTRYMRRRSAFGMVPDIGALRFHVGEDEFRVEKRFIHPHEGKPKLVEVKP